MRRFSSYGPINDKLHYYTPRKELIEKGYTQLVGEVPGEGGHYFTVWAPRQCGKTWIMQQVVKMVRETELYDIAIITMGFAKEYTTEKEVMEMMIESLENELERKLPHFKQISQLRQLFTKKYFKKPIILVLDEFDALNEKFISRYASIFRELYISRTNEENKPSGEKSYLLHGLALIGVRSVLGIENIQGSPFNIQRSLKIPNLSIEETRGIFDWYEKESGQKVEPEATDRLYKEVNGQPGLTCWFGELLTEGFESYTNDMTKPITPGEFEITYAAATYALPNNNILNLISKAKEEQNKSSILDLFQTGEKLEFSFDDTITNSLYMNGVIEYEVENRTDYYIKFSCPFVQKRLFNYFARTYFKERGRVVEPLKKLGNIITPEHLEMIGIFKLYQQYLDQNKSWMFLHAPRRSDQRIYEAVFHFGFFAYLRDFLRSKGASIIPEFPTGNGKIDLLIRYNEERYGIELKSFRDEGSFHQALGRAAQYGKQLGLNEIFLVSFIETIDEETRSEFESPVLDEDCGVTVKPFFIQTGIV